MSHNVNSGKPLPEVIRGACKLKRDLSSLKTPALLSFLVVKNVCLAARHSNELLRELLRWYVMNRNWWETVFIENILRNTALFSYSLPPGQWWWGKCGELSILSEALHDPLAEGRQLHPHHCWHEEVRPWSSPGRNFNEVTSTFYFNSDHCGFCWWGWDGYRCLFEFLFSLAPRAPEVLKDLAPGSQPPFLIYNEEVRTDTNKIEEFLEEALAPPQWVTGWLTRANTYAVSLHFQTTV